MTDKPYRIITGGCSFSKRADIPIMKEKEKTWTNAIEEYFDIPFYYHTGEPASGNSLISRRVIYALSNVLKIPNIKKEDILVSVMWSDPIRTDLFGSLEETYKWPELTKHKGNNEPLRLGEGMETAYNQENRNWGYFRSGGFPNDGYAFKEYKDWFTNYYENYYTTEYSFINTFESILRVQSFCKLHKIKYVFHTMKNIFTNKDGEFLHKQYKETEHLFEQIDFENFVFSNDYDGLYEYAKEHDLPFWDDNLHVEWDGHKIYFNKLIKTRILELI